MPASRHQVGCGGGSLYGAGGIVPNVSNSAGVTGNGYGSGGSGGVAFGATNVTGGAGRPGLVVITSG